MSKRITTLLAIAVVGIIAAGVMLQTPGGGIRHAPDIVVDTIGGQPFDLGQHRPEPVLVTFWSITCAVCIRDIPELIAIHEDFSASGLALLAIAVSSDPPNIVVATSRAHKLPYHVGLDITGDVARAFGGLRGTPTTFLIAGDGRVVMRREGELNFRALREKIRALLAT